jgi:hypothetical protein
MSHARRNEAALRVRAAYPQLPEIFAALRAAAGAPDPPPPDEPDPVREPDPIPEPAPSDPLAVALLDAARAEAGNADDLALALAMAVEDRLAVAVRDGAVEARRAGVPGEGDVPHERALDAILAVLAPYAAEVAAADRADPPHPPAALLDRIRRVARSAGVVEAVRGTGWSALQRFGKPYCSRPACYGRNGSLLTDARLAAEGYPPYGDGCNCFAEPANLP